MISNNEIKQIISIATHAISPYNTQPWRFKIHDNKIDIFMLRSKNFFLKLEGVLEFTLGALLENLSEAAKSLGYNAQWPKIKPIHDLDTPCVSITFKKNNVSDYSIEHILSRHTNRLPYSNQPLSDEHKFHLQKQIDNGNIQLLFIENKEKNYLAEILEDLEFIRLSNRKLFNEMLNYIRTDNKDNYPFKLNIKNLGISQKAIRIIQHIKSNALFWHLYQLIGTVKKEKQRNRNLLNNSGTIAVFNLIKRDYQDLIDAGRHIQRILNEMQKLGIASMSYVSGLYLFDVLAENPEIFSNNEKNTILNCKWDMETLVAPNRQKISFIVRAGYFHGNHSITAEREAVENLLI